MLDHLVVRHNSVEDPWPVEPGSVSVVVTSLPYWGRRSYGDDGGETGRPGQEFVRYMSDCRRWTTHAWDALADDGLMFVNIGDVSSKSGGAGGDYAEGGRKAGQRRYRQGDSGLPRMQYMNLPGRFTDMLQGPLQVDSGLDYADGPRWLFRCEIVWDKCLSGGTVVYADIAGMGPRPIALGELVRQYSLGSVRLWNGDAWTPVVGWNESQRSDGLRLTFRSGERVTCTPNHRWITADGGEVYAADLAPGDRLMQVRLPGVSPGSIGTGGVLDDDIGWLVGTFLADGSREAVSGIEVASHVDEVERAERLNRIADVLHATFRRHDGPGKGVGWRLNGPAVRGLVDQYVAGSDAASKHLRAAAWRRSDAFLHSVLAGYLEGDGHFDSNRWQVNLTDNPSLVADLRCLSARLGWSIRAVRKNHTGFGREWPGWHVDMRPKSNHQNARCDTEVVSIERIGLTLPFYDVEVADEPAWFALASGVMSHNSPTVRMEDIRHARRQLEAHEKILVFAKTPDHRYFGERATEQGNVWHFPPVRSSKKHPAPVWRQGPMAGEKHPAPFPLELPRRCLEVSVNPGELVVDPFHGSGTTGTASQMFGCRYVGLDLYV